MARHPHPLPRAAARRLWLRAQCLDTDRPFGAGPGAVAGAVARLGYVQIDTINVVERCHHHILWTRIPDYVRDDLAVALGTEKTVFEYWGHALAYLPVADLRFHLPAMRAHRESPDGWFGSVSPAEIRAIAARIRRDGPLSIRDIDDDPVEKTHLWASRKPTKRVLENAFYAGLLTVSARTGMVKTYELSDRHFGWPPRPRPATPAQVLDYRLDRALRAQGAVSLDSVCYLQPGGKADIAARIEARVRARRLVPVAIPALKPHWATPEALATDAAGAETGSETETTHILSPFDPLVIQRARLADFFGHDHRFEAYVPAAKRNLGYFALPVLIGDRIAAAIDTKADRATGRLILRQWTWLDGPRAGDGARIEEALHRFARFQFGA